MNGGLFRFGVAVQCLYFLQLSLKLKVFFPRMKPKILLTFCISWYLVQICNLVYIYIYIHKEECLDFFNLRVSKALFVVSGVICYSDARVIKENIKNLFGCGRKSDFEATFFLWPFPFPWLHVLDQLGNWLLGWL